MDKYLQGFNDGYKKAMEHVNSKPLTVTIDRKEVAKAIVPEITRMQERIKRTEQLFRA